jgi:hypothetical protein
MKVSVPVYSEKNQHGNHQVGATMEHRCKNEINRTNKVSYTKCIQIAFIINPKWIKGRRDGSYQDCCTLMRMLATRIELTKCRQARPDFGAPPQADRFRPVDGLRTSSTDNTDPYLLPPGPTAVASSLCISSFHQPETD